MRAGKSLSVSSADIRRLKAVVQDRNAPQKHVWRAEIVLLTADGVGTNEIMRRTAKSKTCVWRWQERFLEDGFDGLLRDKTRPSRIKPLRAEATERVVGPGVLDSVLLRRAGIRLLPRLDPSGAGERGGGFVRDERTASQPFSEDDRRPRIRGSRRERERRLERPRADHAGFLRATALGQHCALSPQTSQSNLLAR